MTNLTLSKEELCLISIALNEYQFNLDNYHLDEMKEVSTKIDNHYKQLITNWGKSWWQLINNGHKVTSLT